LRQVQRHHTTLVAQVSDLRLGPGRDRDGDDKSRDLLPALGEKPVQRTGNRGEDDVVHGSGVLVGETEDRV